MQQELSRSKPSAEPFPTTRDLAEKFGVNNSTVFRHFVKYEEAGHLWRSEGGRFYDARMRSLVEKPRPIACLLRRIELWSFLYQEWMEGIATACEEVGRATLLWHDEDLVCHGEVGAPPTFATPAQQKESLATFLKHYGNSIGGLVLDQIWCDEALDSIPASIRRKSVILGRPGPPDMISIIPDWKKNAALAIRSLQSKGCELIYPVSPFDQDPAINHALSCIHAAAKEIDYPLAIERKAATASDRKRLLDEVSRIKQPIGLIVPEDNIAQLLFQKVKTRGLATVHILSIQGTRHSSETPRIRTDYAALGAKAIAALTTAPDNTKNGANSPRA